LAEKCSGIDHLSLMSSFNDGTIYSHDGVYDLLDEGIIQRELSKLNGLDGLIGCKEVYGFVRGVQAAYKAILSHETEKAVVANNRVGFDPDHWFEINLANVMLFDNLNVPGKEVLPGRLFTTRMPRNIDSDTNAANNFAGEINRHNLKNVVVLVETHELAEKGSASLLEFYASLEVNVLHHPIIDYSTPDRQDFNGLLQEIIYMLAEGHNVLIHCAGGTGRTGLTVAGIVKSAGIKDPTAWIRRVKSTYVETFAQENFVASQPPVFDDRITTISPVFAKSIVAEQLIQLYIRDKDLSMHAVGITLSGDEDVFSSYSSLRAVFAAVDVDNSHDLSVDELDQLFVSVGATTVTAALLDIMVKPFANQKVTQTQFVNLMAISSMNERT
jgi:protein-tyrosine phosphatase